jgi:hypothetical protein
MLIKSLNSRQKDFDGFIEMGADFEYSEWKNVITGRTSFLSKREVDELFIAGKLVDKPLVFYKEWPDTNTVLVGPEDVVNSLKLTTLPSLFKLPREEFELVILDKK